MSTLYRDIQGWQVTKAFDGSLAIFTPTKQHEFSFRWVNLVWAMLAFDFFATSLVVMFLVWFVLR